MCHKLPRSSQQKAPPHISAEKLHQKNIPKVRSMLTFQLILDPPLNNATEERHVKFDLEDDFDLQSETHKNEDTKADDVAITMHPE